MYTSLKLLICISGWFHDGPATALQDAAHREGFATYWAEKGEDLSSQGCAATIVPSDADWARTDLLGVDTGARGWRPLSRARAHDVISTWAGQLY